MPLHVYEYRGNGKERVPGHPLYFLLHDSPNPEMTSFIFRETAMIHLLLWGNSFSQIIRDGMRRVVGLYPLLPNRMSVDRDEHGELVYTYTPMSDSNPNLKSGQSIKLRREDVLHIPGLGFDGLVDISDWPHSRPTIERKLVRSIWHSNNNEDPDNQAHNEEDDAPVPFTGTISHEDISYTYEDGYLVREKNEDGETSYSYQNEYDHKGNLTGKYVSRKETRNKDGSMSEVEYVYAATANNIYLFKERERSKEPKDTPSYMDEWDSERITYHAPIGYGWYATTVYEDGERVGSSLSQGAPGGKASQYTIDQSALGLGSHYSSYYDEDGAYVPFSSLIDTEFPVVGDEYLWILTKAIEWLNRKVQETVTVEIHANIRDGVPDVEHIVDFTERIRFDGNEYFLMSNSVELTPRSLKQTIKMTRWY